MIAAHYLHYSKGQYKDPKEALEEICKRLGVNDETLLFPSQSLYLGYIGKVLQGFVVLLVIDFSPDILL